MHRNPDIVLTKQERIATLAKQSPRMGFTSLAYLMDLQWLLEAYHRTRKNGAAGVDGQTWHAYGAGRAYLIRYADDFVIGFTDQADAHRVKDVLAKRFGRYGLSIHPEKTRLVRFNKPNDGDGSSGRPESFDLLGFTHYWGRSLRGNWVAKRKTSDGRLSRGLRAINEWCRGHRHEPLAEQQQALSQKIRGHCAYYGITGNSNCLSAFRMWAARTWRYWLSRRNRERGMTRDRFNQLLGRYPLPAAVAIHSTRRHAANP